MVGLDRRSECIGGPEFAGSKASLLSPGIRIRSGCKDIATAVDIDTSFWNCQGTQKGSMDY